MLRLTLFVSYYLLNLSGGVDPVAVVATAPLALLCFIQIGRIKDSVFKFADMFWFIMYLYFVIGPIQGVRNGYLAHGGPVDGYPLTTTDIVTACMIPFIFGLVVAAFQWSAPKKALKERSIFPAVAPLMTAAMVIFFGGYVATSGFHNLFLSRADKLDNGSFVSTIFYAALIVNAALFASIWPKLQREGYFWYLLQACVVFGLLAVVSNPLNSARFFILAAWVPVGFIFLRGRVPAAIIYSVIGVGLTVIMPIMSVTSRFGLDGLTKLDNFSDNLFSIPFIDVFDMLAYEINYIHQNGMFWGGKTLGALLFFVPRALWTGKETLIALDMGEQLVSLRIAGTDNLSLFFGGEFYADAGLIGVLIGSGVLCTIVFRIFIRRIYTVNGIEVPAILIMATLPILMRGPIGAVLPLPFCEILILALMKPVLTSGQTVVHQAISRYRPKKLPAGTNDKARPVEAALPNPLPPVVKW